MPVMGLPGCVMYAGATIFDLMLPKVAADVPVTRADIAALGEGGLCLGCKECHYPICPFRGAYSGEPLSSQKYCIDVKELP